MGAVSNQMQICQALIWQIHLEDAIKDADAILLLVKHTEFSQLQSR